jgi:hypothetical protein
MNFDDLSIEITEELFPSAIYERTKENPHEHLSVSYHPCAGSLDEYASRFLDELFAGLDI